MVDSSSNEVDVLVKVTTEMKTALDSGAGAVRVTNNSAKYLDGGRTSLATVLNGTSGHAGIEIKFGAENGGANRINSVLIEGPRTTRLFYKK